MPGTNVWEPIGLRLMLLAKTLSLELRAKPKDMCTGKQGVQKLPGDKPKEHRAEPDAPGIAGNMEMIAALGDGFGSEGKTIHTTIHQKMILTTSERLWRKWR